MFKAHLVPLALSAVVLLGGPSVQACTFDTDCELGSQCLKNGDAINGACVGGLFPGNSGDSDPAFSVGDSNGTYGNTCSFDSDCGVGSTCVKNDGVFGACM